MHSPAIPRALQDILPHQPKLTDWIFHDYLAQGQLPEVGLLSPLLQVAAGIGFIRNVPPRLRNRQRFGTCNYIQEHHNIILLGATGSGKTYLACALGMAAARRFYAVKYIRLPDLLVEFQIARGNGTIRKLMAQYRKYALLIIDEWLLYPLKETEARDLLEIVESRYKRNSTIFCFQFGIPGWSEKLSESELRNCGNRKQGYD